MAGKWMASIMASLIFVVIGAGIATGVIRLPLQDSVEDAFRREVAATTEAQAQYRRGERRRSERRRGGGVGFGITIDLGKIFSGSQKKKRKAKKRRTRKPVKKKARRKPEKRKARRKPEKKRKEWAVIEGIPQMPIAKLTAVRGWKKYYEGMCNPMDPFIIVKDGPDGKYCIWRKDNQECGENKSTKGGKCTCNPGFDGNTYPNCKPAGWKDPGRQVQKPPTSRRLSPLELWVWANWSKAPHYISIDPSLLRDLDRLREWMRNPAVAAKIGRWYEDATRETFWQKFKKGTYFGTEFGADSAQYCADQYVATGKWRWGAMGLAASTWMPDTWVDTALTLGPGVVKLAKRAVTPARLVTKRVPRVVSPVDPVEKAAKAAAERLFPKTYFGYKPPPLPPHYLPRQPYIHVMHRVWWCPEHRSLIRNLTREMTRVMRQSVESVLP